MSSHQAIQIQALIRLADEFESISDYLERISEYRKRLSDNEQINSEYMKEYIDFFENVWEFFHLCFSPLFDDKRLNMSEITKRSEQIRLWADDIRDKHLERVSEGKLGPLSALTYSDLVVALRKLRAHALNVAQALNNYISDN